LLLKKTWMAGTSPAMTNGKYEAVPTIYYIRHGETDWNAQGRLQGGMDIPLNDLGRKQAAAAGSILGGLLGREGRSAPSLSYVASPLGRARRTMELVRGALNLPPRDYALDDRLREIGYGRWEGSTFAQMRASDPELFAKRRADKWTVPPPGGESYAEVQARVRDWYDGLIADTVAVAHGGTARALMVALAIKTSAIAADLGIEQGVVYVFADGRLKKYR
jgi:broad specificity phosphatase PhoE